MVEGSQAGRLGRLLQYCINAKTMPRAQNRAGKGSIILWRWYTFPIFLLFIYGGNLRMCRLVSIFKIYCYVNVIYKFWKPLPVTGSGKILANSSSLGSHLCNDLKKKKQLWECVYYLWKSHFGLIMTQPTTYTRTLLVSLEHQNGPGHNILNNKEKGGIGSMFLSLAK